MKNKFKHTTIFFVFCSIFLMFSCKDDIKIGDHYQGGIVFYIDDDGGGLVAALSDQSTNSNWGCVDGVDDAAYTKIGAGKNLTEEISSNCSNVITAASICKSLELNGYNDWFLPSKGELDEMYYNIGPEAPGKLSNIGEFYNAWYWSSSALENFTIWGYSKHFGNGKGEYQRGYQNENLKGVNAARVRAIRSYK